MTCRQVRHIRFHCRLSIHRLQIVMGLSLFPRSHLSLKLLHPVICDAAMAHIHIRLERLSEPNPPFHIYCKTTLLTTACPAACQLTTSSPGTSVSNVDVEEVLTMALATLFCSPPPRHYSGLQSTGWHFLLAFHSSMSLLPSL